MPARKSNGGGWGTGPEIISAGYLVNQAYSGPGKDCPGVPVRPGTIYDVNLIPGLRGGRRTNKTRGGTQLQAASFANYSEAVQPVPAELTQTHRVGMPGIAPHPMQQGGTPQQAQQGGRYEVTPGFLDPVQAIGASGPAPFSRIACEAGTTNMLNPNMDLQRATTAIPIAVTGGKRSKRRDSKRRDSKRRLERRGSNRRTRHRGGAQTYAPAEVGAGMSSNFPVVHVGAADSMRYNAPTAGYRNDFEAFPAGGAVPGITLQTPYDARAGNLACSTTGGSRKKNRVRFGGNIFHSMPAPVSALSVDQVTDRSDFDGTKGGLPVKYGGKRSKRGGKRGRKTKRVTKRCKQHHTLRNLFRF